MTRHYAHFIDGREFAAPGAERTIRACPANGRPVASFILGTAEDTGRALLAARRAFDRGPWPRLSGEQRGRLLEGWAARVAENLERLARIEVEEVGKPIRLARADIEGVVGHIRYSAGLAMQLHGETYTNLGEDMLGLVTREPVGVVGMIVPWNFPALIFSQKVPYALASGCCVVVKPSELTSGSALELARLASEAGIPPGVINIVTGTGPEVGEALTASPLTDMSSFTGSTRVGRRVIENSAATTKKVAAELGGKAANVVFADADLADAVDAAVFGIFFNQGECCVSATRLLVEEAVADQFVERVLTLTRRLRVGDPFDEATDVGALIHAPHLEQVLAMIERGKADGARLRLGGRRLPGEGLFIEPAVFDQVAPDNAIFCHEVFGPVLSIASFRTLEEAISLANDTEYGLANAVWSKNIDRLMAMSRALKSGTVYLNTMIDGAPQLPIGGYKSTGFGRELGRAGMEEFTEIKSLVLRTGARRPAYPAAAAP